MRIEHLNALFPGSSDPHPLGFSLDRFLGTEMILFDDRIPASKILRFIIVVITSAHAGVELLKVDIFVLNNILPN
jgi:hypothetical protein